MVEVDGQLEEQVALEVSIDHDLNIALISPSSTGANQCVFSTIKTSLRGVMTRR